MATVGLSATVWVYACGDGATEPTPTPTPDPSRPATVTVTPASAELTAIGATVQLAAKVLDQTGQAMAGAAVTWSSDATSVATVSAAGLVTAAGNGAATITATAGSASGTARITVVQEVSAVAVTPAADTLLAFGDTLRLSAEASDANGHVVEGTAFRWASADTQVAVVDSSGLVTGIEPGEVAVTATAAGVSGHAELTVAPPVPTTVAVTPDTVAFTAIGQNVQLAAQVLDQARRVMKEVGVSWSSGDTAIAVVDSVGLLTAAGAGSTTVAAAVGDVSGVAAVTVMQSAGSVVVMPAADTIAPGDTLRLIAQAFDENGHAVAGAEFNWLSSNVPVARVDDRGLVHGVAEGNAMITAAAGEARGTAEITVENPDRAALVAFYEATDGPNWINSENWLTDRPLREWYGVSADRSGRVVRLNLRGRRDPESRRNISHGLNGRIPAELGNLGNLEWLDLERNELTGPIPPELGNLTSLENLNLSFNRLSGGIPSAIGSLTNLENLNLSINRLSGRIPSEVGGLSELTSLWITQNELGGSIPPELGSLANLDFLRLDRNRLTGPIPPELGKLHNLTVLDLRRNELNGPIPSNFQQLAQLESLGIGDNTTICVPGTSAFNMWLRGIENHDAEHADGCNAADISVLKTLYDATGGEDWTESDEWFGNRPVEDWHGIAADSLGRVTELNLDRNGLTGRLPPNLGDLTQMTVLRIGRNPLSGRLPATLTRLSLVEFHYAETELCVPAERWFQTWLNGISSHEGTDRPCILLSEREILERFYHATGGPDWINNGNWLTDEPLGDWYGIDTNGEGRVIGLDLSHENLTGRIPTELSSLANVTRLDLSGNNLTGPIPSQLGHLSSLTALGLSDNGLSGPIPPELESLAELTMLDLSNNVLDGPIPPELGSLANLGSLRLRSNRFAGFIPAELGNLSELTDLLLGDNDLTGPIPPELGSLTALRWLGLTRNNLSGSIPPELGSSAELVMLDLSNNDLDGPIPAELGNLSELTDLSLSGNKLTGPIPPELGSLTALRWLRIARNNLSGPIPPELGSPAELVTLDLSNNALAGPIPPELGSLAELVRLDLSNNSLDGPIPPELGNLSSVTYLAFHENALTGLLPPRLGDLATLKVLELENNNLTGRVPTEFGRMASLQELYVTNNVAMSGALPVGLTDLTRLDALLAGGTDLCAPSDTEIQAWLAGVRRHRIKSCPEAEPSAAYLTQGVQSREFPVPLVAGDEALLRVFPTAGRTTSEGLPAVRVRFYVNGRETHVENIPGKAAPIPTDVDESSLSKSVNAEIPGQLLQPGLEMVIEVDPDGTLDSALGVAKRIPKTGRLAVDVRALPFLDLTLIPFIWTQTRESSIVDLVGAMAADPETHELLHDTRTLLPIGDLAVTAHEPVLSSSNNAHVLVAQTKAIRAMEGGTGHYMGLMSDPVTGASGVAFLGGRSSFSCPCAPVIAHELGHNLSLQHAPCGAYDADTSFPYADGSIGAWGYDFTDGGKLVRPSTPDLMSYCGPPDWISDYHFANALRFRLSEADGVDLPGQPFNAPAAKSLLVWGGVRADSMPYLEPTFVVDAPSLLPDSAGEHRLNGQTASGAELFSLSFAMLETADGDGSSSFAFVLPIRPAWASALASITLSGPGGSVTLDGESDLPMAILRNPRNGQVRAILRDLPSRTKAAMDAAGQAAAPGLEILISRGIPDASAWNR